MSVTAVGLRLRCMQFLLQFIFQRLGFRFFLFRVLRMVAEIINREGPPATSSFPVLACFVGLSVCALWVGVNDRTAISLNTREGLCNL